MANATLTRVRAGGGAEDYDAAPAAGADKWTGTARAFVNDQAISEDGGGRSSVLVERTLAVDDALAVAWARGDIITYTYGGQVQTGEVHDVKRTSATRLPGVVRLKLRNQ